MDVTRPFSVGRGIVLKNMILLPSTGWPVWVALFAGLVLAVFGCFFDVRFLIMGLMVCVAVVPVITGFLYFSYSLSPAIVANLLPHTLERCPDGFLLRIWCRSDQDDGSEEEPGWRESGSIMLYDSKIVDTKTSFEFDMLFFKDSLLDILFVPRNNSLKSKTHNVIK